MDELKAFVEEVICDDKTTHGQLTELHIGFLSKWVRRVLFFEGHDYKVASALSAKVKQDALSRIDEHTTDSCSLFAKILYDELAVLGQDVGTLIEGLRKALENQKNKSRTPLLYTLYLITFLGVISLQWYYSTAYNLSLI